MFADIPLWHEGELEVQRRAGVASKAERLSGMVRHSLPDSARGFLVQRQFAVLGSLDSACRVWASVVAGEPGFMQAPDPVTVVIHGGWSAMDPLLENIARNNDVGMLVIDFAARRRIRVNGKAESLDDGIIRIHIEQAFSNCPRYIQARVPSSVLTVSEPQAQRAEFLSDSQKQWIGNADTFFIATAHPRGGADASHRGGNPGFIHIDGVRRLIIPDYNGNSLFNTLGNIHLNPHAGLVFVDFEAGRTLQLTGRAVINWDRDAAISYPGAERLVEFDVDEVLDTEHGIRLGFQLESYSPYNPALRG
jgi:predicted pyridoxine 5'-phosphate oxidase superfamily flavin-nucleotide-binding protein